MNKVELSGRLVKDVEITTSKSGVKVGNVQYVKEY